jgi:MarR family transcriptional regulator, organic hydroperoxide resistance regulator
VRADMENARATKSDRDALGLEFQRANRALRKLRGKETQLREGQLSQSRFELLDLLGETQPTSSADLAASAGVTSATISRMLTGLVADGFVQRLRSDSDKRLVMLALTTQGQDAVEVNRSFWRGRWTDALGHFDRSQLKAATAVMARIAEVFEETEHPISPAPGRRQRDPDASGT